MSTQLNYYCVPSFDRGISIKANSTTWQYGSWRAFCCQTPITIQIAGVTFAAGGVLVSSDTTYQFVIDIGIGNVGSETTILQVPYSYRGDTAADIENSTQTIMFPETYTIPEASTISARLASSTASESMYHMRLIYLAEKQIPSINASQKRINNFCSTRAVDGISVSERAW